MMAAEYLVAVGQAYALGCECRKREGESRDDDELKTNTQN
jgi:hypothetical protein